MPHVCIAEAGHFPHASFASLGPGLSGWENAKQHHAQTPISGVHTRFLTDTIFAREIACFQGHFDRK